VSVSLLSNVGASSANTTSITTAAINTVGADCIVVAVSDYPGGAGTVTVSDSQGNTWTALTPYLPSGGQQICLYYKLLPSTNASHTFSMSCTAADYPCMMVAAFSGVASYDQVAGAIGGQIQSQQPGSLTPPANGALFVTALSLPDLSTPSVDSGFTITDYQPYTGGANMGGALAYLVQATAGAVNPNWTWVAGINGSATQATFLASVAAVAVGSPLKINRGTRPRSYAPGVTR